MRLIERKRLQRAQSAVTDSIDLIELIGSFIQNSKDFRRFWWSVCKRWRQRYLDNVQSFNKKYIKMRTTELMIDIRMIYLYSLREFGDVDMVCHFRHEDISTDVYVYSTKRFSVNTMSVWSNERNELRSHQVGMLSQDEMDQILTDQYPNPRHTIGMLKGMCIALQRFKNLHAPKSSYKFLYDHFLNYTWEQQ